MKKAVFSLLAAAVLLTSCAQKEATVPVLEPVEATQPVVEAAVTETTVPAPAAVEPDAGRLAYQTILENFAAGHTLPDWDVEWMDGFGDIENNEFALADVDGDGQEELILRYTTAPMAGMFEVVYGLDGGNPIQKLSVFPATTYYTGGLVEAGWSHNQGLAGEFWPYTLMGYNPSAREYEVIAHVDAWDGTIHPTDYEGNPYPKELDSDGYGTLFLVTQGEETETMAKSAYDRWHEALFGSAAPIPLEFRKLTAQNIAAITE